MHEKEKKNLGIGTKHLARSHVHRQNRPRLSESGCTALQIPGLIESSFGSGFQLLQQ